MTDSPIAVVCVPTYRRPAMLARTLDSLAAQRTDLPFRVVVVDNDARGRQGFALAERVLAGGPLRGLASVEPEQGNCNAINTCFRVALAAFPEARYLLMIDDDEVASPEWLGRMVEAAEDHRAHLVGGPVFPAFAPGTSAAVARHPVFFPAYGRSGAVPRIYGSGNVLIRRDAFARLANPTFHASFNFLGGGDTDFFLRCQQAGLDAYWNHEAEVTEEVPPERTRPGWILRRCLRIGAINMHVERRQAATWAGRAKVHAKSAAAFPFGLVRGAATLLGTGSPLLAAYRPFIALGRILASFGVAPQQYRATAVVAGPVTADRSSPSLASPR